MPKRSNTEDFIIKACIKHNNVFSYNNVMYLNNNSKVMITCHKHGDFAQTPSDHLRGYGCPECKRELIQIQANIRKAKASEEFSEVCTRIHNGVYDYSKVQYISAHVKVDIVCKIHGVFTQTPHDHKQGNGCKLCGAERSNLLMRKHRGVPTRLYYIYFKEFNLYKLGCTVRDIPVRFRSHDIKVLEVVTLANSSIAYTLEKYMLRSVYNLRYKGPKVINGGDTELLVEPIDFIKELGSAYVQLLQDDL